MQDFVQAPITKTFLTVIIFSRDLCNIIFASRYSWFSIRERVTANIALIKYTSRARKIIIPWFTDYCFFSRYRSLTNFMVSYSLYLFFPSCFLFFSLSLFLLRVYYLLFIYLFLYIRIIFEYIIHRCCP